MPNHLQDALTLHSEALAAWNECRAKARQLKDPQERAAALQALKGERPVHPYVGGISVKAVIRGSRRMLAPVTAKHTEVKDEHADVLATLAERRAKALEIEDPVKRAEALEVLKGEKPTHPTLVAIGCAVVGAVVLASIPAVRHHVGVIVTGGLTLWLLTALVLGQQAPAEPANAAEASGQRPGDDQAGTLAEAAAPAPQSTVPGPADAARAVAELASSGGHVALSAVAARLASRHPGWKRSTGAAKALLAEAGVRARDGVRVEGVSVPGVHRDDVPPLPSPSGAAPDPVVVAGQSNNNNANNTETATGREGFVLAPDPENPARTIVVYKAA